MKTPRSDLQHIRREQIVEAAVAVIAEKGLQNLSLSEIEDKTGMKRGQLTYYFKFKEDILLAVFDRLLQLMYQGIGRPEPEAGEEECSSGWAWVQHLLAAILESPGGTPEFHCLQYTFLAQITHREDFRQRLATLYEEWRTYMAEGLGMDLAAVAGAPSYSPRTLASLVQGILHGLSMQLAADPEAFPREEMLNLCLDILGRYLHLTPRSRRRRSPEAPTPVGDNGTAGSQTDE